ncbi:ABC transporter substrate-binding protein [Falsiroseomonas sp.]|uniref:ABC transporter substrate-binding protein n=1 Tax=Falsiroseomonas sp. TaxID=2870721 RepID=UPI003F6F7CE1
MAVTTLRAAIGAYPETAALLEGRVGSDLLALDNIRHTPPSKAFPAMVRQSAFEVSEMAIATFLMAKAYGKPMVLLPVVLAERAQESALLTAIDGPVRGPADLAGAPIAVRAYSQTTGMWLRGSLAEFHGIRADTQRWTTFEDAHVPEFMDPPWVTRGTPGQDLLAMTRSGEAAAGIFGNDLPDGLRTVCPDPEAAGAQFRDRHGFIPVNHLVVARRDVADARPELLVEVMRMLAASGARMHTRESLRPALALAIRYCTEQGMMPRPLSVEEAWEGLPAAIQ